MGNAKALIGSKYMSSESRAETTSLGKASLWTSILGVVLPIGLAILRPGTGELCLLLLMMLELIALGCGIAARRTAAGKGGLVISGILLPLSIAVFLLFDAWTGRDASSHPPAVIRTEIQAEPAPQVVPNREAPKGDLPKGGKGEQQKGEE
jgi:hypothetical protein